MRGLTIHLPAEAQPFCGSNAPINKPTPDRAREQRDRQITIDEIDDVLFLGNASHRNPDDDVMLVNQWGLLDNLDAQIG